jgi:hypothetical protein
MCPEIACGKLWSLSLTPGSIYEMFCFKESPCRPAVFISHSSTSPSEPLKRYDIKRVTSLKDAKEKPDVVFEAFFRMPVIEFICRKEKFEFSNRYLISLYSQKAAVY